MSDTWTIVSFVVGTFLGTIGVIFMFRTGCGWGRRRKCKALFWTDIANGELADKNICQVCALGSEHPEDFSPVAQHETDPKCWSKTVGEVFGASTFRTTPFPKGLEDSGRYLCVDINVLLAMIFAVIPDAGLEVVGHEAPGIVFDGSVVEMVEEEGNIIAHVKGKHRRRLTREDCDGLVRSFPPWYRRIVKLNRPGASLTVDHPCFRDPRNCARGGWVLLVTLSDIAPTPAYLDRSLFVDGEQRGRVLRAGCIRVRIILEKFQSLGLQASNLDSALTEIGHLLDSGPSMGTHVSEPRQEPMSDDEWLRLVQAAVGIFDTAPAHLTLESLRPLGTHAELVIYWASMGAFKVLQYWKHPGRDIWWDERLKPGRKVYLQDCRRPLK